MTIGGGKPPSPPAAPTTPVTLPTWVAGTVLPTSANTAPLPNPRAAAMLRKATVASAMCGWKAVTTAPTGDHAERPEEHLHAGEAVRQPAAHRAGDGRQQHEPGRAAGRVGGAQPVHGLEEGRQVDAEG